MTPIWPYFARECGCYLIPFGHSQSIANDCAECAIEEDYFLPVLVVTNATQHKLCAPVGKLFLPLIDLPKHKILAVSAKIFVETKLHDPALSRDS